MKEPVCIRQRFHKSFLCVRRRKRHLNAPPKCLSVVAAHVSCVCLIFLPVVFFGGGVWADGLVFTHVGWLKYLSYSVIMCSQGHNYMSENVMQR